VYVNHCVVLLLITITLWSNSYFGVERVTSYFPYTLWKCWVFMNIYIYILCTNTGTEDRIYFNFKSQYLSVIWPPDFFTASVYLYNIAVDMSAQYVLSLFCQLLNDKRFTVEKHKTITDEHKTMYITWVFRWSIIIILTWPQITSDPRSTRIGFIRVSRNLPWLCSMRCLLITLR
jgi:hypothetical protein